MRNAAMGRPASAARMAAVLVLAGSWTLGGPAAAETVEQTPPTAEAPVAASALGQASAERKAPAPEPGFVVGSEGSDTTAASQGGGESVESAPGESAEQAPPPGAPPERSGAADEPVNAPTSPDEDGQEEPSESGRPGAAPAEPEPSTPAPSPSAGPAQEREQQLAPQLSISKSVSPNPMIIGDEATYTITVTNTGDETAEDIVVTDTLSPDVSFVSASSGCAASGGTVTCGGPGTELAAGQTLTYTVTVQVDPGLSDGTNITNPASVAASNAQGAQTQNIAQTQTETDVEITKTGEPATVNPDGTITYTIVVTNHGPSEAVDVFVQDPTNGNLTTIDNDALPEQCPPSGLTISCNLGTLQPGESVELEITLTVNSDVAEGTEITNCATVYTGSRETDTDNNHSCATTIVGPPDAPEADLAVQKAGPATVNPDGTITYTITVTNNGPDLAENAYVEDAIDTDHTTIETVPDQCEVVDSSLDCSLGDLEAGDTRELTVVVRANADAQPGTVINNCAEAHTTTPETTTDNNAACVQTEVEGDDPSPSPSPSPTDGPSPSPSPTDEPSPSPSPTDGPSPSPSPTDGPTDEPSPTPSASPTDDGTGDSGYEDNGDDGAGAVPALPITGPGAAALAAVGLFVAVCGLVLRLSAAQRAGRAGG